MQRPAPFIIQFPADWSQQHKHLSALSQSLTEDYAKSAKVEDATLQKVGTALWDALQLGDTLDTRKQAAGQQALPIIIASSDVAVLSLPWESLYHPRFGFLGREAGFSLSRHNPTAKTQLPALVAEPLKVLLFTSLPDDLDEMERLDVEAEQVAIQQALMDYERSGEVILEMPENGQLATLQHALQTFQPHVAYLSGHGNFTHDPANQQAYGSFLFEDDHNKGVTHPESAITACFQNTQVQLLILSACNSAKQHPQYPGKGLSNALSHTGIPHVIGMRESVIDEAATQFATHLFHALGKQQPVDIALQQARAAIGQQSSAGIYRDTRHPVRTAISAGQWCLPQLLSHDWQQGLVDWHFTPIPKQRTAWQQQLGDISLPERFIGRRRELSQWQNRLRSKTSHALLITGAGGMGKTALAGKLLKTLEDDGYHLIPLSLRPEHDWQNVQLDMELALAENETLYKKYQLIQSKGLSEAKQAEYILTFLQEHYHGKLALFFDNLESVQQTQAPHALTDSSLQHWLTAAKQRSKHGLKLLVTSRWRLPDWADTEHYALGKPVYGDYVALVRLYQLPLAGERLAQTYQVLGGNFRALSFFANAAKGMKLAEEQAFLKALAQAETAAQTDMALAKVVEQCSPQEQALLQCLLAYQTAVPLDGVEAVWEVAGKIPLNPPFAKGEVETLLQQLLAVSLVEQYETQGEQTTYQLAALVRSWLLANGVPQPTQALLQAAAEFLLWQLENGLNTIWEHRLATHAALLAANLTEQGQRLVLKWIVGPLNRAGMYRTLLDDWLPPLAEADNQQIKGEALGQIGKQYLHIGQYDTALDFLKKSLAIRQEIGDKSGEGTTLNNISQIFKARGDYDTALDFLKKSLAIQQEIGDKQGMGATLNNISQIFKARGDYNTALEYLQQSLAIQQEIGDKQGMGATLNNISQIYDARGDYNTALEYLQQSLAIRQEIGDVAGLCATLFNMGHIHLQNEEVAEAVQAWVTVYGLAKKMNLAQALEALERLAGNIGLPGGLQVWEKLAQQMNTE